MNQHQGFHQQLKRDDLSSFSNIHGANNFYNYSTHMDTLNNVQYISRWGNNFILFDCLTDEKINKEIFILKFDYAYIANIALMIREKHHRLSFSQGYPRSVLRKCFLTVRSWKIYTDPGTSKFREDIVWTSRNANMHFFKFNTYRK